MNHAAATMTLMLASSTSLGAAVTQTDPGAFVDGTIESAFEARARLDDGRNRWKNALFDGRTRLARGANERDAFDSGFGESFTLRIDSGTGEVSFDIAGLSATAVLDLGEDDAVAGFRFNLRSERNAGSTALSDLSWDLDGETVALDDASSGYSQRLVRGESFYFDRAVEVAELSGRLTFSWDEGTNTRGGRFQAMIFPLIGEAVTPPTNTPVPAPATLALAGVALLAGPARRRR